MRYEIFTSGKMRVPRLEIDKVIKKFVQVFKINNPQLELSLAFVSPAVIKKLNWQYRQINRVTDVLSFGQAKNNKLFLDKNFLGEVIICYQYAVKQAKNNQHSVTAEIKLLLTHGLTHLMGFDHQNKNETKKMMNWEQKILGADFISYRSDD